MTRTPRADKFKQRLSKKWLCHFFEKASLRSAPQLSADSGQFDAHSAQSVFRHAHVAAENELYCFRVCGRETLRGFFRQAEPPLQGGHEMAMGALRTSDLLMNGGNVPLLFSVDRITRLHRTLASLAKGGGKNSKFLPVGFLRRMSAACAIEQLGRKRPSQPHSQSLSHGHT